jgi:hypothetical protein
MLMCGHMRFWRMLPPLVQPAGSCSPGQYACQPGSLGGRHPHLQRLTDTVCYSSCVCLQVGEEVERLRQVTTQVCPGAVWWGP